MKRQRRVITLEDFEDGELIASMNPDCCGLDVGTVGIGKNPPRLFVAVEKQAFANWCRRALSALAEEGVRPNGHHHGGRDYGVWEIRDEVTG
jgi:hypothetical protein